MKVSTRNIPVYRDPAVILIDHLKEIYIGGELDPMDTSRWFARLAREDHAVGLNVTGNALDEPGQAFHENFGCRSERGYSGYRGPGLEILFGRQPAETDPDIRRKPVWDIGRRSREDAARPVILYQRGGTCWREKVHGHTPMANTAQNGYRFEDMRIDH